MWILIIWIIVVFLRLLLLLLQHRAVNDAFLADRPMLNTLKPLSLVVIFRNADAQLNELIPTLLDQEYGAPCTLYLVNDGSNDSSARDAKDWARKEPRIIYIDHEKYTPGKKGALAEVMERIDTEWVLFTDVDCRIRSDQWMWTMMSAADVDTDMVLGLSPYDDTSRFFWLHYDTVMVALSYISWAIWGRPYMSVGRNVMINRAWWLRAGGVAKHLDKAGGDDDLTLQKASKRPIVRWAISPSAHTISAAPKSGAKYIKSKARHLSAGTNYTRGDGAILGVLAWIHALAIGGMILAAYYFLSYTLIIAMIYFVIIHFVLREWMAVFNIRWSFLNTVISDMITPVLYAYIVLRALSRNEKKW